MKDFTNILREHHLKATPQRLAILESICMYRHINIDKLYDEVKQKFNSISLATIYKNINAMTKNMLLQEIKLPNEKSVYEMIKEEHSHLMCNSCGEVIDIQVETENITKDIEKKYEFRISQSDVVLSGTCKKCQ
jgi:Fur family peroxide stress response transcriptional regulator